MVSQVRILGPIEVERRDGRRARVPRGRTLSLLALLLVHRGAIVSPDRIVDELWDGDGPQNARNAVQVVASRLRAAVGDGVLVSEAHGYGVRAGDVDADRFEDALRRGREQLERASRSTPPRRCARRSPCGAGRRSPTSRARASRSPRSRAWRSCG